MGKVLSYFRKKKDVVAELESIEKKIKTIDDQRKKSQVWQKRLIGSITLYSIIFYIISSIIFFVYYFPPKWPQRLLYLSPIIFFPFILYFLRKFLHFLFVRSLVKQDAKLVELRDQKKEMLEEVMNTETYKKAKEILDRFDPMRFSQIDKSPAGYGKGLREPFGAPTLGTEVRRRTTSGGAPSAPVVLPLSRQLASPLRPMAPPQRPPSTTGASPTLRTPLPPSASAPPVMFSSSAPSTPRLPRPILPKDRSMADRLIDALVGDGPERRFALVCRRCASHNGMALAEEFPYLGSGQRWRW